MITVEQVDGWLSALESERIEFKEAKKQQSFEDLVKYSAAIANEGGGFFVLGITPKLPRRIVGSNAFPNPAKVAANLLRRVQLRILVHEIIHPAGRVVVFEIPSRPLGVPVAVKGTYWMRAGEELTPMTPEALKKIFDEAVPDFSAEVCTGITPNDLDSNAIDLFQFLWHQKSGNEALLSLDKEQLLEDAGLLIDGKITLAALVLLGTPKALQRNLGQAEVIFEYRSSDEAIETNQRIEFRQGFLTFHNELWDLVNLRNDRQHYQEGLFVREIRTFNERACREAILNAVSHRDYRSGASVFVRQYPRRLVVESPGGFPPGVTEETILTRQNPRNRLLAESLAKCGFVERSGQGADLMFRLCIEEGKSHPDFSNTDADWVFITLNGTVKDPQFVVFLEQISKQKNLSFGLNDLLVLSFVRDTLPVPEHFGHEVNRLLEAGIIERIARKRLVLSRSFYRFLNKPGEYTRRKGLDHETNKALIEKHISDVEEAGARMADFLQVLPSFTRSGIRRLLDELKEEGRIFMTGAKRTARYWMVPDPPDDRSLD